MNTHRLTISIPLFLLLIYGCMPTLIPPDSITIQKVIEVPGIQKDVIYERSRIWIAKTFRSSKAVIEYENKETGVIIGNGIVYYTLSAGFSSAEVPVRFTMKEDIKDGRIRITFDNLYEGTLEIPVKYRQSMDRIRPKLLSLADSLGEAVRSPQDSKPW
ncbi:MAG: hypothetical protein A2Z40_04080 [Deltaproteobacteria bacterium RBG_19FT_COMBO_60_16]|nr:MAG: hypothetical protein A2Z40_04080 [Deltaproteobacteria bacterium RBG_19FT_COMBO_60_16]